MTTPHQPTSGFEFPDNAQDAIEQALRSEIDDAPFPSARKPKPTVRIVEDDKPKVVVQAPSVTPMASAEAISIDLPSRFFYYDFKDLYVKPLRVPQMAKISKAHETGDLQTQVEAISSLLSTSTGDSTNLAMRLTMADYQAVLYWLRMNSFSKAQMRVTSTCTDKKHNEDVVAGKKPASSLEIQTVVLKSQLQTRYLEAAPDPEYYSITVDDIPIPFVPETLSDTIQFLAHPKWKDEEFQYKSRIAAVLGLDKATGREWNWDQRIQFVDEFMTPDMVVKAIEFADLMDGYGVVEAVETVCKGCGSKGVTTLTCDPISFLSPKF